MADADEAIPLLWGKEFSVAMDKWWFSKEGK
jgi:hypothetical protein